MKVSGTFARGLLLGAGLMYLMDPSEGDRRRSRVRDQGVRVWRRSWVPGWHRSIQYVGGALGAAALVYGATRAIQERREGREEGHLTPNYAYLR